MILALLWALPLACSGTTLDMIGISLLRTVTTNLNGGGVRVAQVESVVDVSSPPTFEVNPGNSSVNQPVGLFAYYSSLGTATTYPNSVGAESYHANIVAGSFFGLPDGVATNVDHVDNYYSGFFYNSIIAPGSPAIPASIANQSYIFGDITTSQQITLDKQFDWYAAAYGTFLVSGVGNADPTLYGGAVNAPATCYNGIGVGAIQANGSYLGSSSIGPTLDNGRCKPDIVAPGPYNVTSFSTPAVAGAAAVLRQAALRGDGGGDTTSASDMRTLKAFLLNGAIKPEPWTNSTTSPLDARYGAGVLNVFNSYMQLAGGKHAAIEMTSVSKGGPHPPGSASGNIPSHHGWDFQALSSSNGSDSINHYYFDLTNQFSTGPFSATATLVWIRQEGKTEINDLNLYLYDAITGALVAESVSSVDNVEHLHVETLSPGRYDLQVLKRGGSLNTPPRVTSSENYALAWEFFNVPLDIQATDGTAVLTWPLYPDGFAVQKATGLNPANWISLTNTPAVDGGLNRVELPIGSTPAFFRLKQQP